jgi:hypothetical protein
MKHIKKFETVINEGFNYNNELPLSEQNDPWWDEAIKIIKSAAAYPILPSQTGELALKNILNATPVGIIRNMSIAAANGDANGFKSAWDAAGKYSQKDYDALKKSVFNDMKSFGSLLKDLGL